jgi:hypothetical protein
VVSKAVVSTDPLEDLDFLVSFNTHAALIDHVLRHHRYNYVSFSAVQKYPTCFPIIPTPDNALDWAKVRSGNSNIKHLQMLVINPYKNMHTLISLSCFRLFQNK